jgi:conjugal transfer pilin signal peptidase TrbI
MPSSLSHRVAAFCATVVVSAAFIWFMHNYIAFTVTPSLRYVVFYLSDRGSSIRQGDYVVFNLNHPIAVSLKLKRTIKEVVCKGGQKLVVLDKEYFCNGSYVANAKNFTLKGEPVENFKFNGVVPADSLFVIGHHKDSFDSRYFGFIKTADVEKMAEPLF